MIRCIDDQVRKSSQTVLKNQIVQEILAKLDN